MWFHNSIQKLHLQTHAILLLSLFFSIFLCSCLLWFIMRKHVFHTQGMWFHNSIQKLHLQTHAILLLSLFFSVFLCSCLLWFIMRKHVFPTPLKHLKICQIYMHFSFLLLLLLYIVENHRLETYVMYWFLLLHRPDNRRKEKDLQYIYTNTYVQRERERGTRLKIEERENWVTKQTTEESRYGIAGRNWLTVNRIVRGTDPTDLWCRNTKTVLVFSARESP